MPTTDMVFREGGPGWRRVVTRRRFPGGRRVGEGTVRSTPLTPSSFVSLTDSRLRRPWSRTPYRDVLLPPLACERGRVAYVSYMDLGPRTLDWSWGP